MYKALLSASRAAYTPGDLGKQLFRLNGCQGSEAKSITMLLDAGTHFLLFLAEK
jgi:hypothetical protein